MAICTRNRSELLRRALRSLQAQSVVPDEVLVVDNAPADEATRAVTLEFPSVCYRREAVRGLDAARNRALAAATGDVVAFLDDDAVADREWVRAIVAAFEDPRVGACTGRVEGLDPSTAGQRLIEANGGYSRGLERIRLPRDAHRPLHGRAAPLIAWTLSVGSGCSMAVRRELALSLGGFDEALDTGAELPGGGDHDMLWRVVQSGHDLVYEPAALAHHEHRRGLAEAVDQIVGHQRAFVAMLVKTAWHATPRERLPVIAFLGWRLVKPGVRLARRAAGRDPLPASVLLRMWRSSLLGLGAYALSSRAARQRRREEAWRTQIAQYDLRRPSLPVVREGYERMLVLVRDGSSLLELVRLTLSEREGFGRERLSREIVRQLGLAAGEPDVLAAERESAPAEIPGAAPDSAESHRPPISVVVCTRDRPELLATCLESLSRLDYAPYEVVVVDNASRGADTARVVAGTPFRYVREERPGLDWARNRGLGEARNEIVAYVDDDVQVDPGWLAAVADAFRDPDVGGVTGLVLPSELETRAQHLFELYGNGMKKGLRRRVFRGRELTPRERLRAQAMGVGGNMAFRREVLQEIGGFDTALDVGTPAAGGGDLDIFRRLVAAGFALRYEPAALAWHRHRREMDGLRRQLRDNGRSYGAYLIKTWHDGGAPQREIVLFALEHFIWLTGRLAKGLARRHSLPVNLLWAELVGTLQAPLLYRSSRRRDRDLRTVAAPAAGVYLGRSCAPTSKASP